MCTRIIRSSHNSSGVFKLGLWQFSSTLLTLQAEVVPSPSAHVDIHVSRRNLIEGNPAKRKSVRKAILSWR